MHTRRPAASLCEVVTNNPEAASFQELLVDMISFWYIVLCGGQPDLSLD
jgi:hypothetical protein